MTTPEKNRTHWNAVAEQWRTDPRATISDLQIRKLEVRALLKFIKDGDHILELGCGNGSTAIAIAVRKMVTVHGMDFSEKMIQYARLNLDENQEVRDAVQFEVGDLMQLDFHEAFEKVLTERTVQNLENWDAQAGAILAIREALKPGGTYLMMESTIQGLTKLNSLRRKVGLPEIPMPWHNLHLDETRLLPFLRENFTSVRVHQFTSSYYVGSRVIYPRLIFWAEPRHDSLLNKLSYFIPNMGSFGVIKLFVAQK